MSRFVYIYADDINADEGPPRVEGFDTRAEADVAAEANARRVMDECRTEQEVVYVYQRVAVITARKDIVVETAHD